MLREYAEEHRRNGEYELSAGLGLENMPYGNWLEMIRTNAAEGDPVWGRSLLYLRLDEGRLIGLLNVRYDLPKELSEKYGDIGYGVRPSERGKGHATEMLLYGLKECRDHGLESVILGCYKDNKASSAVIEKCGGVLFAENDNYEKGRMSLYYTIVPGRQ